MGDMSEGPEPGRAATYIECATQSEINFFIRTQLSASDSQSRKRIEGRCGCKMLEILQQIRDALQTPGCLSQKTNFRNNQYLREWMMAEIRRAVA